MAQAILVFSATAGFGGTAASPTVHLYDARPLWQVNLKSTEETTRLWDTFHVLAALQGLANRERPQLYVRFSREFGVETDAFWFDEFRRKGGWLADVGVREAGDLDDLLRRFRGCYRGLVVYDPEVPATSNAASTAAGCEDLLPVRFDRSPNSLYRRLTEVHGLPVRLWLVNPDGTSRFTGRGALPDGAGEASGSAKCDVYRWAVKRYLTEKRCRPGFAAYYIDAFWMRVAHHGPADLHTLPNHDYFIANRAFFFDLSCWGDETPNDDLGQALGLDRRTLLEVLRALWERADGKLIKIGGFTPWPYKYTDAGGVGGRHGGVPTEWELSRVVSQFNGYVEADAAGLSTLANASFTQHYPLPRRQRQPNPKPGLTDWRQRGWVDDDGTVASRLFVGHYVGDYDAPSWLAKAVAAFFRDPQRGAVPLGWAFNPNLADRIPHVLSYAYEHATTNDWFIAGDSGAGYVNARALSIRPDSGLPSGLKIWADHCRRYYARWGMTITGFLLDGSAGSSTDLEYRAYQSFSPDGIGTHFEKGPALRAGIPTCPERDLPDDVDAAARVIVDRAQKRGDKPGFLWARSILKPPAWYATLSERVARQVPEGSVQFVDPYSFFGLIKTQLAEPVRRRPARPRSPRRARSCSARSGRSLAAA